MNVDLQCSKCNGKCCRYFCFEIDEPDCYEEFEDIRWYLLHEGVSVHIDEGSWFISIMSRCLALDEASRCRLYEDRPLICRGYTQENCDATSGNYGYDELFETAEQVEAYARKVLGDKKFEKARTKTRAKLEDKPKKKTRKKTKKARKSGQTNPRTPNIA